MEEKGIQKSPDSSTSLSLILEEDHIADLLLNFLGKKEKASYVKREDFQVYMNDLEQFYYLLDAKIQKEQNINVQIFEVQFHFDDQTTRTIRTIESLNKYAETRNVIPTYVSMEWNIVVKFPNSRTVETQKIGVFLNTAGGLSREYSRKLVECGYILLEIESTNRPWSNEVLNLFKEHIDSIVKPRINNNLSRAQKLLENIDLFRPDDAFLAVRNLFIFSVLLIISMATYDFLNKDENSYGVVGSKATTYDTIFELRKSREITSSEFNTYIFLVDKSTNPMKFIEEEISNVKIKEKILESIRADESFKLTNKINRVKKMAISLICLYFVVLILRRYCFINSNNSYVLTTPKAEKKYKSDILKKERQDYLSASLIIFTVIAGLLVNYLSSLIL